MKLQFNDTLTSTFEYPSESSLLADDSSEIMGDGISGLNGGGLLGSMPKGNEIIKFLHLFYLASLEVKRTRDMRERLSSLVLVC